jgi:hypothetical protein
VNLVVNNVSYIIPHEELAQTMAMMAKAMSSNPDAVSSFRNSVSG